MSNSSSSCHVDCVCDECEEETLINNHLQLIVFGGVRTLYACNHYLKYCLKHPMRDSALFGSNWIWEVWHGNDKRFFEIMRMRKGALQHLISSLVSSCNLDPNLKWVTLEESMAIFLMILGGGATYPYVVERVQRSSETVSNHFHMVLDSVCKLGCHIVRPTDPEFKEDPPELVSNPKAWPFFKGCIRAIDGTHIAIHIPESKKTPWMNRKGVATTNVLAICDFKMNIIFAQVGMEGSMHDSRVLAESMKIPARRFPLPPPGKYFLGDAGYPLMKGILTPYRKTRYHLGEFRANRNMNNANELFNYRHSSLRSIIERTFGVLKKRWRVLTFMSMVSDEATSVSLPTQMKRIWACITLHNFIRRYDLDDLEELGRATTVEDIELSSVLHREQRDEWFGTLRSELNGMVHKRDEVRGAIFETRL